MQKFWRTHSSAAKDWFFLALQMEPAILIWDPHLETIIQVRRKVEFKDSNDVTGYCFATVIVNSLVQTIKPDMAIGQLAFILKLGPLYLVYATIHDVIDACSNLTVPYCQQTETALHTLADDLKGLSVDMNQEAVITQLMAKHRQHQLFIEEAKERLSNRPDNHWQIVGYQGCDICTPHCYTKNYILVDAHLRERTYDSKIASQDDLKNTFLLCNACSIFESVKRLSMVYVEDPEVKPYPKRRQRKLMLRRAIYPIWRRVAGYNKL